MSDVAVLQWQNYLTISAAAVGAVLGILHMWDTINQRRVRLRVTPIFTFYLR